MSNETSPRDAGEPTQERSLPSTEAAAERVALAARECVACDYDLRGSTTPQCPECGFVQPAGAVPPGVPVAARLERSPASVAAAVWLMRSPERAIGAAATMTLPFERVVFRLLPMLALMMVLVQLLLTVVFVELNGSLFGGRILGDAVYFGMNGVFEVLLGIGGSYLLATILLAWWRTPGEVRRPLDLAAILYGGATLAALTTSLLRAGFFVALHFNFVPQLGGAGSPGLWAVISIVEYGITWLWCYVCVGSVTPSADRPAVAMLIGAVMVARWSIEERILTAGLYLSAWFAQLAVNWL